MKRSDNFRLPYLEYGDILYASDELQRWHGLDANLGMVSAVQGTGVAYGINVTYSTGNQVVSISPGLIQVGNVWYEFTNTSNIGVLDTGATYNIYALPDPNSYISVDGYSYTYWVLGASLGASSGPFPANSIELGRLYVTDGNTGIVDESQRRNITFGGISKLNVLDKIRTHQHSGSPSKINLSNHITGTLPAAFLGKIPGSRFSTGTLNTNQVIIADISHIGRVKESCIFEQSETYTQDDAYRIYHAGEITGNLIIYKNGVIVSGSDYSLDREAELVIFNSSNTAADRITICKNLNAVNAINGGWVSGLPVRIYKNGVQVDSGTYSLLSDEGKILFTSELLPTDEVKITIMGVYIQDVGEITHDEIDYYIGNKTAWLGWHPSYITEFNLGQMAINFKHTAGTFCANYQLETVILPQEWTEVIDPKSTLVPPDTYGSFGFTGPVKLTPEVVINIAPTLLSGNRNSGGVYIHTGASVPVSGLYHATYSQSFIMPQDNIYRAVPWLAKVGSSNDYTLVASLYDSDTTNLPIGNTLAYVECPVEDISPYGDEYVINFTGPIDTVINNKYALVLKQVGGDVNNYIEWWGATESYPSGSGAWGSGPGWSILSCVPDDFYVSVWSSGTFGSTGVTGSSFVFDTPSEQNVNPLVSIIVDCSGSSTDSDPSGERFNAAKTFVSQILDYYTTGTHEALPEDKTALFDILVFAADGLAKSNYTVYDADTTSTKLYAVLGAPSKVTNSESAIVTALDEFNDTAKWTSTTPLTGSILLAAQRLMSISPPDAIGYGRQKVILLLTDGMDNTSGGESQDGVIEYLQSDSDNPISVSAIGFGSAQLAQDQLESQAAFLFEYANKTSGRYYSDTSTGGISGILSDLSSNPTWTSGDFEQVYSLNNEVYLETIDLSLSLPGNSSGTVDVYTAEAGNVVVWTQVGEGAFVLSDPPETITINRYAKHIKFIFHLTAGSIPSVTGGFFGYSVPFEEYLFTKEYTTERPVHEVSMSYARIPENMPTGSSLSFAVLPGNSTNWTYAVHLDDYDRELIPGRNYETTTTSDNLIYTLRNGAFVGADIVKVYVNNVLMPSTYYMLYPHSGTIVFNEPRHEDDTILCSIGYNSRYRIGIKLRHTDPYPPTDFNFSWIFTIRPDKLLSACSEI